MNTIAALAVFEPPQSTSYAVPQALVSTTCRLRYVDAWDVDKLATCMVEHVFVSAQALIHIKHLTRTSG